MSWQILELSVSIVNWWRGVAKIRQNLERNPNALRMGALSAARINWLAFFDPVSTHPDVVITGVAARDKSKAEAQISKYKLTSARAFGSYAELLADPSIDAVYIGLPNGLHYEWAAKALEAGKHVLLEKPFTSTAEQAIKLQALAKAKNLVCLEAFHWRFYPAAHRVKELVAGGTYGAVESIHAKLHAPTGAIAGDDIRMNFELAGGACMDLTYVFSATAYYAAPDILESAYDVLETSPRKSARDPRVDEAMRATYRVRYPDRPDVTCTVDADLNPPGGKLLGIFPKVWEWSPIVTINLEKACIEYRNFVGPYLGHKIVIFSKDANGYITGEKTTETCYKNESSWGGRGATWWTTYRYQLEAFVAKIQNRENAVPWISMDESVKHMNLIDQMYEHAGLPPRP